MCKGSFKEIEIEWYYCKVICSTDLNVAMTNQSHNNSV